MSSIGSDYSKKYLSDDESAVDDDRGRIRFSDSDLTDKQKRTQSVVGKRRRRRSFHSQSRLSNLIFTIQESAPENALPGVYKTISHQISQHEFNETTDEKNLLVDYTWNVDPIESIINTFSSDAKLGLKTQLADHNAKTYGLNIQSKPPSNILRKIFVYFFGGFGVLLFVGGILCIIAWKPLGQPPAVANLILGIVLFIVFVSQAVFNFWQDFSSSRVMESIYEMIPLTCSVVRDGQVVELPAKNLVPGDIVHFKSGDKVPADMRVLENTPDLSFDKSILTGESKPCPTHSACDTHNKNYLESACIAMQGTSCSSGSGTGVVVSIGDATVFGQIAKLSSHSKSELSPIQKEILRFVLLTTCIIFSLIVLVIILWAAWLRQAHHDWINVPTLIVDIVSVAVAFMPEGLPIALTTCLIITANAMRKNKILCKSLSVVETLGSMSVLCSDKTGTITENKMFVTDFFFAGKENQVDKESLPEGTNSEFLYSVAGICTDEQSGNATDMAVKKFADTFAQQHNLRSKWTSKTELSFNSKNKFMVKLMATDEQCWNELSIEGDANDNYLMAIKGAPDILLEKCDSYLDERNNSIDLDSTTKSHISSIQRQWSQNGRRVILLAKRVIPKSYFSEELLQDGLKSIEKLTDLMEEEKASLTFVGMLAICDPPRDGIVDTLSTLKAAGIKIVLVTGDFELTAISIGRMCGILSETENVDTVEDLDKQYCLPNSNLPNFENEINRAVVVSGIDINHLNECQWDQLCNYTEIVFARTTPEQKLTIVTQFKKRNHVVGMIGDGINDAPSLREADIGVSMSDGCDIAKEASDLILMENVNSIVEALRFGRLVFENLKKTLAYLLPAGTYSELWPILINVIFGLPQVLSSFNMIIICCLTDCLGAMTLAYEQGERNLLLKKPRVISKERLVDFNLLLHSYFIIGTFYTFTSMLVAFINFQRHGILFSQLTLSYGSFSDLPNYERVSYMSSSIYFVNLVIMQMFNLLSIRTRHLSIFQMSPLKNYYMFIAMPTAFGITFIINYIPAIQNNLGTWQVPVEYYFIAVGFGFVVMIYDELRKLYARKHPKSIVAKLSW